MDPGSVYTARPTDAMKVPLYLTFGELRLVRTEMAANVANCDDPELNADYKRIFQKCQRLLCDWISKG